jgi:hypothetical protein
MTYYFQMNRSHVNEAVLQAYLIKTENLTSYVAFQKRQEASRY